MGGEKIKRGKARVIKVNIDAVHEVIWELFMERGYKYFGLKKVDKENIYSMKWDSKSQDLICVVYNLEDRDKIDMEQLMESMDYTTDTFFSEKCYRSIQLEEKKKKTDSQ